MSVRPTLPTADDLGRTWEGVRSRSPLVQCLTNVVATQRTADVLLAAGAAPAMVDNPHEAGAFARVASAVLVNLGTPQDATVEAKRLAVAAAREAGTPWVLDPVAAGGLAWRTEVARELVALGPSVVRGNASEVLGLAGGAGGRGVDATDSAESALEAARELSQRHGCVVALSGPVDHLVLGDEVVRLAHGHPWLTRVTAVGCSLGALVAACCAVAEDSLAAAATATAALTLAAEDAAARSAGPGSFAPALLDELAALTPEALAGRAVLA
ncbi:hydroxyethylthiazole kinase [Ornithinimicrobium tianjinense]|uniref:Hydroxyethylthiazole kinase n=1 Tax=Ornithinimicrobium tianjinense TaxID=1195761 RepID=A0A917BHN7_9MICO|nr:hydroxyethylthiazole kinase [Ornithinimicrobium tianjinense]GGF46114.1 hydroxyethylthiazole kinase [Ornithinimicrobium tianjinense]